MIDVTGEDVLTLCQASRILPAGRNGSKPHLSTLIRWIRDGVRLPDGRRIRLDACRLGDKWVTSRAALQAFTAALTPRLDDDQAEQEAPPRTPAQRQRSSQRAARQLERAGI